jgi:hypothetical protein
MKLRTSIVLYLYRYPLWLLEIWQALAAPLLCGCALYCVTRPTAYPDLVTRVGGWLQVLGTAVGLLGVAEAVRMFPMLRTSAAFNEWKGGRPGQSATLKAAITGGASFSGSAGIATLTNANAAPPTLEQRVETLERMSVETAGELTNHKRATAERFTAHDKRFEEHERINATAVAELKSKVEAAHTGGIATAVAGGYVIVFGTLVSTENGFIALNPTPATWAGAIWLAASAALLLWLFNRK